MARALRVATASAAILLASAASASAAIRYAEPGGNGSNVTCDQADPCSLQDAVENGANPGDEVIVLPGDYIESNELSIVDINVHGSTASNPPTIFSSDAFGVTVGGASARAADLEIVHTGSLAAVEVGNGALLERFDAVNSLGSGCRTTGGTIRDGYCRSTGGFQGLAFSVTGGGSLTLTLRNVTAVGEGGGGLGLFIGANDGSEVTVNGKSVIARGTLNDIEAFEGGTAGTETNITLDHSNYATVATSGDGTPTVTPAGESTNQTALPIFTDAIAGDYSQAPGSPTIEAGDLDGSSGTLDPDGDARSLDATPACSGNVAVADIGADEFAPALPDCAAPETTISSGPRAKTFKRKATIAFTASEAGSSFECSLDGAAFAACTSPTALKKLARRKHTFSVRAKDAAGNVDATPATRTWKVKKKRRRKR